MRKNRGGTERKTTALSPTLPRREAALRGQEPGGGGAQLGYSPGQSASERTWQPGSSNTCLSHAKECGFTLKMTQNKKTQKLGLKAEDTMGGHMGSQREPEDLSEAADPPHPTGKPMAPTC